MIKNKLTEILQFEKNEIEILQIENSYEFELHGNNYLIVVDQINISESLNDAINDDNKVFYNLEFSDNFYDQLKKSIQLNYIFAYLIYDEKNDCFINFDIDQINNHLKSIESSLEELNLSELENNGVSLLVNSSGQLNILFKSKYLILFLKKNSLKSINFMNNETIRCFDNLFDADLYSKFEEKISKIENLDFLSTVKKPRSMKWDRDEYILCLELYFRVKEKFVKDKKDDPEVQKVYQTLKQKSLIQNRIIRTVDAVYMRLQNFKHVDPGWDVKGLSGGGLKCSEIFEEFVNNRSDLSKEVDRINSLYFNINLDSNYIVRKYQPQDENYSSNVSIKSLNLEDINNLKDRATKKHRITLNLIFKYMTEKNYTCYECPTTFDLLAINDSESLLFEVKSLNDDNFVSQTRSAFFQVQFYEYFHQKMKSEGFNNNLKKIIVFSDDPLLLTSENTFDTYKNFCSQNEIMLWWIDRGEVINGQKS